MFIFFMPFTYIIAQTGAIRYNVESGGVAHRLEQAAHNHLVVGSIPTAPTKKSFLYHK